MVAAAIQGFFGAQTQYLGEIIELKETSYRYWYRPHHIAPNTPKYPLTGKFKLKDGVLTLDAPQLKSRTWKIQKEAGRTVLATDQEVGPEFDLQPFTPKNPNDPWADCPTFTYSPPKK